MLELFENSILDQAVDRLKHLFFEADPSVTYPRAWAPPECPECGLELIPAAAHQIRGTAEVSLVYASCSQAHPPIAWPVAT
jgi:hypothetical protein